MKTRCTALLISIALTTLAGEFRPHKLPLIGDLPNLQKDWKLLEQGTDGDSQFGWNWVIFTNAQTADFLSFASHKLTKSPPIYREGQVQLIYLANNAYEIFPLVLSSLRPGTL
jgi:hypothetical protein